MKRSSIPNAITSVRIVGTGALFLLPVDSASFFCVYTLCGLSDVLDGFVARRTHSTSELGAKLDSIADLLFYAVMLFRVFPILWAKLPRWIWNVVALALLVRFCAYLTAAFKYHRFAAVHTYLNKLTGLMVFLIPYVLKTSVLGGYCAVVAIVSLAASGEELLLHLVNRSYRPDIKAAVQLLLPGGKN